MKDGKDDSAFPRRFRIDTGLHSFCSIWAMRKAAIPLVRFRVVEARMSKEKLRQMPEITLDMLSI